MQMAEVEERLGKLEVQMARVEQDVAEIKTDQKAFIREIRKGFEEQRNRSQDLEISVAQHHAAEERGEVKARAELNQQGESIDEALRRMPGASFMGRHGSRIERYLILGVLAYLLKIVTIDIDLPRLNKFVATYNALGVAGASQPIPKVPESR